MLIALFYCLGSQYSARGPFKTWLTISISFFASSVGNAGSSGADTQHPAGELQLAQKPSEAQDLSNDLTTDDSHNTVSVRPTSNHNNDGPTSQAGIKDRVDEAMTSRHGLAESWDAEASIPAAHQLRAVSAGDCFSSLLAYSCLHCAMCQGHTTCCIVFRVAQEIQLGTVYCKAQVLPCLFVHLSLGLTQYGFCLARADAVASLADPGFLLLP